MFPYVLCIVLSVIAIPVGLWLGKHYFSERTGLALLLMALSPFAPAVYGCFRIPHLTQPGQLALIETLLIATSVLMVLGLGLVIGAERQDNVNRRRKELQSWKNQLTKDESTGAHSWLVAIDLQHIGDLHYQLGAYEAAVEAFDRAYLIFEKEAGAHPFLRPFLSSYYWSLRHLDRPNQMERISRQLATLD